MSRSVVGALGIWMLAATLANAQDSGPPLTSPTLTPAAEAVASPPAPAAAEPAPEPAPRRPLLVIPGVTAPARTARKPAIVDDAKPTSPPRLAGPAPSTRADAIAPKVSMPLTLEPIPAGDEADQADDEPKSSRSRPTTAPAQAKGRATKPTTEPAPAAGGTRYYPGAVLGRILGTDDGRSDAKSAITIESKSDPAVEAAVKRRVEQKIQETLGDRVNSVDVRVNGRNVVIRARASRFWHRRTVRRTLDTLQMPSGYRGRAELID